MGKLFGNACITIEKGSEIFYEKFLLKFQVKDFILIIINHAISFLVFIILS